MTRKRGCKLSEQAVLAAFRETHGSKYNYPAFPEKFTVRSRIAIICPVHGEFRQAIAGHMRGAGCRECARAAAAESGRLGRAEWLRRFESVHGRGKYDYSKVPENVKQSSKIAVFCPEHTITFYQTPVRHWKFRQGCPECGRAKQTGTRARHLVTRREFERRARAVHGPRYEYAELPPEFSLDDTVIIYCIEHNRIFFCTAKEHLAGSDCGM